MPFDHVAAEARALVDTKHAIHATDHAADDATDHGADRPSRPFTFSRTSFHAAGNTLGLRHDRQCNDGNKGRYSDKAADHDISSDFG